MHQKDLDLPRLFEVLVPTVTFILKETKPSMIGNSGENVCLTFSRFLPRRDRELNLEIEIEIS